MTKWITIAFALCAFMLAGCDYGTNQGKSETQPGGKSQVSANTPESLNPGAGTESGAASSTADAATSNGPSAGAGTAKGAAADPEHTTATDGQSSPKPGIENGATPSARNRTESGAKASGNVDKASAESVPPAGSNATAPRANTAVPQQQQSSSPPVRLGRSQIRQLQRTLSRQGFDIGPADGILGARTRQGIREFQSRRGMQVTGDLDGSTLAALGLRIPSETRHPRA
jgi:hypothetical protein